jgi:hypothetical protein
MAKRKKLERFEVFKRDGFVCQYCGGHPPDKTLEVDHIIPVSKGGTDDLHNLITSCFDCNRGKGKHELRIAPIPLTTHINTIKERERQYKEYRKILANIDQRINDEINQVEAIFIGATDNIFSRTFRISVKKFISSLPLEEVKDAMQIAIAKGMDPYNTARYFCGICWNKIRDNDA